MGTFLQALGSALQAFSAVRSRPVNVTPPVSAPTPFGTGLRTGTNATFSLRQLHEMTPYDRAQAMKDANFVANRLGLGRALVEGCTRYALGDGLIPYTSTGDQAFDDSCNKHCDAVFESTDFDVAGEHDFYGLQSVAVPAMMIKGDCGAAKILRRDAAGAIQGGPQVQMFQSDQIGSGSGVTPPGEDWREGVLYDAVGRRLRFRVLKQPNRLNLGAAPFFEYSARDFLLILDPKRINLGRGMTWFHHGSGSAMRMIDLVELESKVAMLNSLFGAYIKTPTGELPEGFEHEIPKRKIKQGETDKTDPEDVKKAGVRHYAEFLGGALMPVLKEGEEIGFYKNERPSVTFTGFIDWLVNDIAWGFGVPPSYVWAIAGRTGPETRLILNQADWFFRHIQRILITRFCKPVRDFVINHGILTGKINGGRLPASGVSPYLCRWRGPKKITIDERYFYKTWQDRIASGLGTEEEFFGEQGREALDERRTRIKEIRSAMDLCAAEGVPYEYFVRQLPGQNAGGDNTGDNGTRNKRAADEEDDDPQAE